MPCLVDFHCHLDLYPDHAKAFTDCEQAKIYTLAVTTTPRAWPRNRLLASSTRYVRAALGLHPQLMDQRADELTLWEEYLKQARYIGEVGLDAGPKFYRFFDKQVQIFSRILHLCDQERGKILTVHSARASKMVLDLIEANLCPSHGRVVLHWFTGSPSDARRATQLGCYFSVNPEMLSHSKHANMIKGIPLNRLLTETDGPFSRIKGRSTTPSDAALAVEMLARVFGLEPSEMASKVEENLRTLVSEFL